MLVQAGNQCSHLVLQSAVRFGKTKFLLAGEQYESVCFRRLLPTNWKIICFPNTEMLLSQLNSRFFHSYTIFRCENISLSLAKVNSNSGFLLPSSLVVRRKGCAQIPKPNEWKNSNLNCTQTCFGYYPFVFDITCIVIVHLIAKQITVTSCIQWILLIPTDW